MTTAQAPRPIRAGCIEARAIFLEDRVVFLGPLTFDGATVLEALEDERRLDPADAEAVADALTDLYTENFKAWTHRLDAERAAAAPAPRPRRRVFSEGIHTPCPALWAGR